jgi:hypothetical protein
MLTNKLYKLIDELNSYLSQKESNKSDNPIENFKKIKSKYSEKVLIEKLDINEQLFYELENSFKNFEKHKNDKGILYEISFLRCLTFLKITGDKIGLKLEIEYPNLKSNEPTSLKQVRALELIIRAIITEHNGGKQGILNKLNELFKKEIIQSWLKNADETGILSGTSFNELSALFLDKSMFHTYDSIFNYDDGLKYEKNKINSLRYFLNDIRIIRNNIAHNKKVLSSQIELLNLYYLEIAGRVQNAYDKGITIVNTNLYFDVEESILNEFISKINAEFESVKSDINEIKSFNNEIKHKTRRNSKLIFISIISIIVLGILLYFFTNDLDVVENRVTKVEFNLNDLTTAFNNSENIYYQNPTTKLQFLSNAVVDKRKGNYAKAINNYEKYFSFGDKFIDPYLEFISILELPGFEKNKENFLKRINNSVNTIEKICYILLSFNPEEKIIKFSDLKESTIDSSLVYYFYCQSMIDFDKLNSSANNINCDKVIQYKVINEKLLFLKRDTLLMNNFIDKVILSKSIDEYINYSNKWAETINLTIETLKKQGLELGAVIFSLKKLYPCSEKQLSNIIAQHYKTNNKSLNKTNLSLTGKYYRFYNGNFADYEFMEFGSNDEFKWINEKYNLNTLFKYQILDNKIVSSANGINVDINILNSTTIEYNDGNQKYTYKKR